MLTLFGSSVKISQTKQGDPCRKMSEGQEQEIPRRETSGQKTGSTFNFANQKINSMEDSNVIAFSAN